MIACDVNQNQAMRLSDIAETSNNSLVVLRQYGMLGYLRVYKKELTVIERKPQITPFKRDLKMQNPFPELQAHADSYDLDKIEAQNDEGYDFAHIPYAVMMIKACDRWRAAHEGQLPKTFAEK